MLNFEARPAVDMQRAKEKRLLARNAVFGMALGMFVHHGDVPIDKEGIVSHAVLERMVAKGSVVTDDCEKAFSQEFTEITLSEKHESAFVAVYGDDGSCRILPAAYGTEAGVNIQEKKEQQILDTKNAVRLVFYHTHPVQNAPLVQMSRENVVDIAKENIPRFETSRPSNDDIMTMVKKEVKKAEVAKSSTEPLLQKATIERVVTGLGIWEFGVIDGVDITILEEESQKLGSLETYYSLNKEDPNIIERLETIKEGYGGVSLAYAALDAGQKPYSREALLDFRAGENEKLVAELKERVVLAKNFTTAVQKIGFKITFKLHPKYQKMIDQAEN